MHEVNPIPLTFRLVSAVALVILLFPVLVVVMAGLNSGDFLTFPPKGVSLRWLIAFFKSDIFLPAFGVSFGLALLTTLISTVLGTLTAIFLTRSKS